MDDNEVLLYFEVLYAKSNTKPSYTLRTGKRSVTLTKSYNVNGKPVTQETIFKDADKFMKHLETNVLVGKYSIRRATYRQKDGRYTTPGHSLNTKALRSIVRAAI